MKLVCGLGANGVVKNRCPSRRRDTAGEVWLVGLCRLRRGNSLQSMSVRYAWRVMELLQDTGTRWKCRLDGSGRGRH